MRLVVKQQRHQQQHVLQRQHIEIGVIILSGCRLCAALAYTEGSGKGLAACSVQPALSTCQPTCHLSPWRYTGALLAATVLAIIHILSLVLEFGSCSIGEWHQCCRSKTAWHPFVQQGLPLIGVARFATCGHMGVCVC